MGTNTAFAFNSVFADVIGKAMEAPDHSTSRKGKTKLSIQQHFEIFDRDNPMIYELLVAGAYDAVTEGHKRFGIGYIWERIRWKLPIETYGSDFKLNNNFRSRYVRKIEANEPGLVGFFRKRSLRSF
jgi:hypothetical protein